MVARSWITSLAEGQRVPWSPTIAVGGIAMGGDCGVARVDVSADGGKTWLPATLGPDKGKYGFRRWDARVPVGAPGMVALMARCTSDKGETQPLQPIWNPGGFMRANVETTTIMVTA
jgi:hypothetical protein